MLVAVVASMVKVGAAAGTEQRGEEGKHEDMEHGNYLMSFSSHVLLDQVLQPPLAGVGR